MKRLLSIVMAFTCMQVNAQFNDPYLGLKLAWNYTSLVFTNPSLDHADVNFKSGFGGGLYCNIPASEKFAVQPELLFSPMGGEIEEEAVEGQEPQKTNINLNYFSVPVLIRFNPIPRLGIFVGPQVDFLYVAKSDRDNATEVDIQSQINSLDVGGTAGLEYWFTSYFGIYGRYMLGFTDVNDKNPGIDLTEQTIISETRNTGFQVGITLALRSKDDSAEPVKATSTKDADGDGVADDIDKCPTQAGIAKYNGCPIPDTDGDGVNDEVDKCLTQPGTAKYNGCPAPDTDGDGVSDDVDKCPKTAGIAGNLGCPEMILYYMREEAALDSNDMSNLDIVVAFMQRNPDLSIIIEGHTSTTGDDAFNLELSQKRATAAMEYMISKGVAANRMTAKGYGEQFPIGDNSTDEGRNKSRRVVIKIAE